MPRLPTFEQLGPTPSPQPPAGVVNYRATSGAEAAPGAALAQAGGQMEATSDRLFQLIKIEQEKADTTRVEDAWNQYKNAALDLTVGDKGLLNLKGGAAVNANLLQTAGKQLEASRKAIEQTLGNDEQRKRFTERAQVTDLQVKHQVLNHLAAEQREYDKTVMMGSEAAAKAQITAMPTDPGVFAQAKETLMRQADAFLKNQGITDSASVQSYKDKVTDSLWLSRIDALLYSQPVLADAVFRANEKEIKSPELRLQLQARVREIALGVNGAIEADRAITEATQDAAKVGVKSLTPGSREKQMQELDAAIAKRPDDPDLREARYAVEQYGTELNTSGLPNSKDIRALLPIALGKVEKRATELYGPDKMNPDRAAFVKRTTSEIVSKVSLSVQQMEAIQNQQLGKLIDYVAGIQTEGVPGGAAAGAVKVGGTSAAGLQKVTSFSQIQASPDMARAYQLLDYRGKLAVDHMIEKNQRAVDKGDPAYARDLLKRIWAEPGTPGKIDDPSQIYTPENINRLSTSELNHLAAQARTATTAGGRSAQQMQSYSERRVEQYFTTHMMFTQQPDRQKAAIMRWNEDAGKKIDEYVKAGKDPRTLFMVDTPDSLLGPFKDNKLQYLETYINSTPAQGLAEGAAAVKAGAPAASPPTPWNQEIKTREQRDEWLKTQKAPTFIGPDGKIYPNQFYTAATASTPVQPTAVKSATATAPDTIPPPAGAITMDATGKLVQAPAEPPSTEAQVTPLPPSDDEAMPKRIKPSTVAKATEASGEARAARRTQTDAAALARRDELRQIARDASKAFSDLMLGVAGLPMTAGRAIGQTLPIELQRIQAGFRDIVKRGYSDQDADVIQAAVEMGEPFF
ncbi:MAG: hypothetical protein NUV34_07715, partial [Sulfuricaulis sp.]|nr:hypothetical protein [Sulfuricaulis sp.]